MTEADLIDVLAERAAELVLAKLGEPRTAAPESRYVTVAEAMRILRCPRSRVDDLLARRTLTRFKEGRRVLLDRAEVEALVELATPRRGVTPR